MNKLAKTKMNKLAKTKTNKAKRFKEIISRLKNFGTTGWLDDSAENRAAKKDYRILKTYRNDGLDIRLYLSDDKKIRLCVYSQGDASKKDVGILRAPEKDVDILRKINIHPSTGVEFVNGGESDKEDTKSHNLCYLVRNLKWWEMTEDDVVTIFADYCWLIAELHRIEAV